MENLGATWMYDPSFWQISATQADRMTTLKV